VKEQEHSKCCVYEVWRQDDNGNHFLVDTFDDRKSAEMRIAALAASDHKQVYWLKETAV
jgi:hypothetical protein